MRVEVEEPIGSAADKVVGGAGATADHADRIG